MHFFLGDVASKREASSHAKHLLRHGSTGLNDPSLHRPLAPQYYRAGACPQYRSITSSDVHLFRTSPHRVFREEARRPQNK